MPKRSLWVASMVLLGDTHVHRPRTEAATVCRDACLPVTPTPLLARACPGKRAGWLPGQAQTRTSDAGRGGSPGLGGGEELSLLGARLTLIHSLVQVHLRTVRPAVTGKTGDTLEAAPGFGKEK